MIILSIDPGVERTGFALCNKLKLLHSGTIITSRKKTIAERILQIFNQLSHLIDIYQPKKIVLEKIFYFKNKKTVIEVAYIHGAILLLANQKNIEVDFLAPLQIKQAITGYGLADKKAVQKMLSLEFKIKKAKFDDESDAIACGLAYFLIKKN